jgi:hypothetical protein
MRTKTLIAVTLAGAVGTAAAIAGTGAAGGEVRTVAAAAPSAPRIHDIDADLLRGGRLRLEAETSSRATKLTFTYAGRQHAGRVVEVDRDDATKDWARTVGTSAKAGRRVTVRVKTCRGQRCTTRSSSELLERDDD